MPFGKIIYQTRHGQGISTETAELVNKILELEHLPGLHVLELGSGNGVISLMLKHNRLDWKITGIEIQPHLAVLAQENSRALEEEIEFLEGDLREYTGTAGYDLIVTNPPYFKVSESRISPVRERAIARHEIVCNLPDIISCFKRNLSLSGRVYFLYPENREEELIEEASVNNLQLDKIGAISSLNKFRVIIYRIIIK